jgi:hypothetical protein
MESNGLLLTPWFKISARINLNGEARGNAEDKMTEFELIKAAHELAEVLHSPAGTPVGQAVDILRKIISDEREANKIPREIIIKNDRYNVRFLDDGNCEIVWIGPYERKDWRYSLSRLNG